MLRFDCDNEVANPGPLKASKLGASGLQLFIIEQHPCSPWALGSSSVNPLHSSGEEFVRASVKGVMARCSLNGSADCHYECSIKQVIHLLPGWIG